MSTDSDKHTPNNPGKNPVTSIWV